MMDEVYRFICSDCAHHWWTKIIEPQPCPYCGEKNVSRIYLESEEAAMLTALGALTFERDDARRWARHFYRLWKATQRTVASKGRKAKGAK